jgi:hypothetical protein
MRCPQPRDTAHQIDAGHADFPQDATACGDRKDPILGTAVIRVDEGIPSKVGAHIHSFHVVGTAKKYADLRLLIIWLCRAVSVNSEERIVVIR